MALRQPVGLKRVGADLAAEADLRLSLVELPSLFPALGELVLVQTRAKDLHGHLAVFILAALVRSEEHTSELQSRLHLVCRLLLEKKKKSKNIIYTLSAL